ncbi:MAG: alkaline phosphatase PhoX, partial [Myxococcota bacterium]
NHEAAAVDPTNSDVYLTEDRSDGFLYRFRPQTFGDLSSGPLEALEILGSGTIAPGEIRAIDWHSIPQPNATSGVSTRYQTFLASRFNRGEGIWHEGDFMYFATTGDHRVWALDCANQTIKIIYDAATSANPELTQPDNVFASPTGDIYAAEDSGNLEIVALTPTGAVKPVMRIVGHGNTEIAGPALSPDRTRMYFSSQRGPGPNGNGGITYEIEGPFVPPPAQLVPALGILPGLAFATALGFAARFALRRGTEATER